MRAALLAAALLAPLPAAADGCVVGDVVDGDTFVCTDGRTVRLAGLRAPKPAAWEKDAAVADQARAGLARLLRGQTVAWETAALDRHGRLRAQATRADGLWLQGEMLRQGLAMVDTQRDCRDRAAELLAVEAEARAAGRGLWTVRRYQVQASDAVRGGAFRIVEGRVRLAVKRDGVVYLNFGEDWRQDFTLRLGGDAVDSFTAAGLDPLSLQGRRLRMRGWVEWRNGPQMEPDHAEQVEVLD